MYTIHIADDRGYDIPMPLCGRDGDTLALGEPDEMSDCWECRSIAGIPDDDIADEVDAVGIVALIDR